MVLPWSFSPLILSFYLPAVDGIYASGHVAEQPGLSSSTVHSVAEAQVQREHNILLSTARDK